MLIVEQLAGKLGFLKDKSAIPVLKSVQYSMDKQVKRPTQ